MLFVGAAIGQAAPTTDGVSPATATPPQETASPAALAPAAAAADVGAALARASAALAAGDPAAAADAFRSARDAGAPPSAWLGDYARALSALGEFARLIDEVVDDPGLTGPQRADLATHRAAAYVALGDLGAAQTAYRSALALQPGHMAATLGSAALSYAMHRDDEALTLLDDLLARDPTQPEVRLARADLLRGMQRYTAAASDYQAVLATGGGGPRAHAGLALAHLAAGDVEAARQDVAALQRVAPEGATTRYLVALLAYRDGDLTRAQGQLRLLLEAVPDNRQAQLLSGAVHYAADELDAADRYLTQALGDAPGIAESAVLLGAVRLRRGDAAGAASALSARVVAGPPDAVALALSAAAHLRTGDYASALDELQRAARLDRGRRLDAGPLALAAIDVGDGAGTVIALSPPALVPPELLPRGLLAVVDALGRADPDAARPLLDALPHDAVPAPVRDYLDGMIALAQGRGGDAEAALRSALDADPGLIPGRAALAGLALREGRVDEAAQAYAALLEQSPASLDALLGMAEVERIRGEAALGLDWLRQAVGRNPGDLRAQLALAEALLRQGLAGEAAVLLSGLTPDQAQTPAALRLIGMAQLQGGEFDAAQATLADLTRAEPDSIEAWFQLARAQAAAGDTEAAGRSLDAAIALDRDFRVPLVWVAAAELELRAGRPRAALEAAARLLGHFPLLAAGHDVAAAAHQVLGEAEQEIESRRAALAGEPTSARAIALAEALLAAEHGDAAIAALQDWLASDPRDARAWGRLAAIAEGQRRDELAIGAYEQLVALTGPDPQALIHMAGLSQERDPVRALELAGWAFQVAPTQPQVGDAYGLLLMQHGDVEAALAVFRQASAMAPSRVESALHLAEALLASGQRDEARALLGDILRAYPDGPVAQAALALLNRAAD